MSWHLQCKFISRIIQYGYVDWLQEDILGPLILVLLAHSHAQLALSKFEFLVDSFRSIVTSSSTTDVGEYKIRLSTPSGSRIFDFRDSLTRMAKLCWWFSRVISYAAAVLMVMSLSRSSKMLHAQSWWSAIPVSSTLSPVQAEHLHVTMELLFFFFAVYCRIEPKTTLYQSTFGWCPDCREIVST